MPSDEAAAQAREVLVAMGFAVTSAQDGLAFSQGSLPDVLWFGGCYVEPSVLPKQGTLVLIDATPSGSRFSMTLSDGIGHGWIERTLRNCYRRAFAEVEADFVRRLGTATHRPQL